jgi:hypothetical protein
METSHPVAAARGPALPKAQTRDREHRRFLGVGWDGVIVGGHVYRGNSISSLQGKYIFGSFSQDGGANAKLYSATVSSAVDWPYEAVNLKDFPDNLGQYLKGFGQDLSGEIYITTSAQTGLAGTTGKVYKLVGVQ